MPKTYPLALKILHWLMVAMLIWMIWGGRALDGLVDRGLPLDHVIQAYGLHKAVGVAVFFLAVLRVGFRLTLPTPRIEHGLRGQLAGMVQASLYVILLIYPLTGFAFHSASKGFKTPVKWGPLTFPDLPVGGAQFWHSAHQACFYALMTLVLLHVAGALYHALILRDGLFRRILPF